MRHIAFGSVTHMKFPLISSKDATGQLIVSGHPQVSLTQQRKKKKNSVRIQSQNSDISLLLTLFTFVVERVWCFCLMFCEQFCTLNLQKK